MKNRSPTAPLPIAFNLTAPGCHASALMPHIERLDLLLQQEVHRVDLDPDDRLGLAALMMSNDVVRARLFAPEGEPEWASEAGVPCPPAPAVEGCLAQMVARFGLSDVERDVLLLSLMPRLDRRYGALFAYVQPDKRNHEWPTLDLALRLFGISGKLRLETLGQLGTHAPLFRHGLIADASGKRRDEVPLLLLADGSVHAFLTGGPPPEPPLCAQWLETCPAEIGVAASNDAFDTFINALHTAWSMQGARAALVMLRGSQGSGRASALHYAASRGAQRVLQIWLEELPDGDSDAWQALQRVLRDARLWQACLIISGVEECAGARRALFAAFCRRINEHPCPVAIVIEQGAALTWMGERPHILFDMPQRSADADLRMWDAQLQSRFPDHTLTHDDMAAITRRFRPTPQTMGIVLEEVGHYRRASGSDVPVDKTQLTKVLALRSQRHFGKLAQRVTPTRSFEDVMLSAEAERQVKEVMAMIRHRERLLEKGFARKLGRNTGVSALFYGASGTGKTLAAEALASELGVDLIKIDLSTVVNKYIGETEKNLSRIFDLAAKDAGVLFFDEADALFGKRSETKDAHDRHANIEVSYLLQKLEDHSGLVVLSTNHREHLDDAFTRRITFMVEFKFPDVNVQERMWRAIWPEHMPVSGDVDFRKLAVNADVAGGNIRNIAWLASCFAEDEGVSEVAWRHIDRAISLEFKKLGRIRWTN